MKPHVPYIYKIQLKIIFNNIIIKIKEKIDEKFNKVETKISEINNKMNNYGKIVSNEYNKILEDY